MEIDEFDSILLDIVDIVTTLYQLSIVIRNPVPRDRLHKIAAIDMSHFESLDIGHIDNKFPKAPKFLKERLGKANTKRRQIMEYYRKHHDTTAHDVETSKLDDINNQSEKQGDLKGPGTISTVLKSQTTVSTTTRPTIEVEAEAASDAGYSNTSYATSTNPQTSRLHIPPPPNFNTAYGGQELECPYCFQLISVKDLRVWK